MSANELDSCDGEEPTTHSRLAPPVGEEPNPSILGPLLTAGGVLFALLLTASYLAVSAYETVQKRKADELARVEERQRVLAEEDAARQKKIMAEKAEQARREAKELAERKKAEQERARELAEEKRRQREERARRIAAQPRRRGGFGGVVVTKEAIEQRAKEVAAQKAAREAAEEFRKAKKRPKE